MMFTDRLFSTRLVAASVAALVGVGASAPAQAQPAHRAFAGHVSAGAVHPLVRHFSPEWQAKLVYSFSGPDGANPQGELEYRGTPHATTLYGTTQAGGAGNAGTLYSFSPQAATLTGIYSFGASAIDGVTPVGGLIDSLGDLANPAAFFGVTNVGGAYGYGAIYEATANGAETVVYSFTGGADGANPAGRLVSLGGCLYGTTSAGAAGYGTVFKYSGGTLTTLHTFTGGADGGTPLAGLSLQMEIPHGNYHARIAALTGEALDAGSVGAQPYVTPVLYGTTSANGGTGGVGDGTVFTITPSGTLTTVFTFFDNATAPGSTPVAELVSDYLGNMYGTTYTGGSAGVGEVFKIAPNGKFTLVHDFSVNSSTGITTTGANPEAPLTISYSGDIYGTTGSGGTYGLGNVFELLPGGNIVIRHEFSGPDGAQPEGKLVLALDGFLYGATYLGGANGAGAIFSLSL